jgi:effector-binding domain-containing protein
MPIGIAGAISRGMDAIKAKGYAVDPRYMMLEDETGFFSADTLIALKEIPENDPNVVTWEPATLYSVFYRGEFRGLSQQVQRLIEFFESAEKRKPRKIYTWVSNCPKCWKTQGGPATVLFAV